MINEESSKGIFADYDAADSNVALGFDNAWDAYIELYDVLTGAIAQYDSKFLADWFNGLSSYTAVIGETPVEFENCNDFEHDWTALGNASRNEIQALYEHSADYLAQLEALTPGAITALEYYFAPFTLEGARTFTADLMHRYKVFDSVVFKEKLAFLMNCTYQETYAAENKNPLTGFNWKYPDGSAGFMNYSSYEYGRYEDKTGGILNVLGIADDSLTVIIPVMQNILAAMCLLDADVRDEVFGSTDYLGFTVTTDAVTAFNTDLFLETEYRGIENEYLASSYYSYFMTKKATNFSALATLMLAAECQNAADNRTAWNNGRENAVGRLDAGGNGELKAGRIFTDYFKTNYVDYVYNTAVRTAFERCYNQNTGSARNVKNTTPTAKPLTR